MSTWVDVSLRPHNRTMLVRFKRYDMMKIKGFIDTSNFAADLVAEMFAQDIVAQKPKLAGCVVHAMEYNLKHQTWDVIISHSSLEPVELGCECPEIFLEELNESR